MNYLPVLLLLLNGLAASQPTVEDLKTVRKLGEELRAASLTLKEIERKAYEANPKLKTYEELLRAERSQFERALASERQKATDYVNPRGIEAVNLYQKLKGLWQNVALSEAAAKTSENEPFYIYLTHSPGFKELLAQANQELVNAGNANPSQEDMIQSLLPRFEKQKEQSLNRIQKMEQASSFPPYVLAQARTDGQGEVKINVIEAYLAVSTPAELVKARKAVRDIEVKMTTIWPEWKQTEIAAAAGVPGGAQQPNESDVSQFARSNAGTRSSPPSQTFPTSEEKKSTEQASPKELWDVTPGSQWAVPLGIIVILLIASGYVWYRKSSHTSGINT